jgi:diaminopimelate epimerase
MARIQFVKMEGAGNDYVYINGLTQQFPIEGAGPLVRRLADRHFGIGGDGVILLTRSDRADVRMVMWNADGSRGAMCGNGVRCLAKLAHDEGVVAGLQLTVETEAGIKPVELLERAGRVVGARVDMGIVRVESVPRHVEVDGVRYAFHVSDAGNPHAVIFVAVHPDAVPVERVGPALQTAPPFADGVNVEFVQVAAGELHQRTWERGAGETLACGSGATVAALAAVQTGRIAGPRVGVRLRGGYLVIEIGADRVVMEGPATEVFRGTVELELPIEP